MSNDLLFFFLTPDAFAVMIPILLICYIIWAFVWGTTFHMVIASLLILGTIILLYYVYRPKPIISIQGASPNIVIVPGVNRPVQFVPVQRAPVHHAPVHRAPSSHHSPRRSSSHRR